MTVDAAVKMEFEVPCNLPSTADKGLDDVHIFAYDSMSDSAAPSMHSAKNMAQLRMLRRKVDIRLMPLLLICETLSFLDKVLYNYAQVMNIESDLHLSGNDISNAASALFIAAIVAVIPNTYILQRYPVGRWLGLCVMVWGLLLACHAALRGYEGLVALRVLSGLFESTLSPSMMLLSSSWYARREQPIRFSIWFCGMGVGQILGGLLSFAFQHISPDAAFASWRLMFLVLGLVTIVLGVGVALLTPESPMVANFLSMEEKSILMDHLKDNKIMSDTEPFQLRQIGEALIDFQMWIASLIVVLALAGSTVITTFSAMLIRNFGFSSQEAALVNMPSGLVNVVAVITCGLGARFLGGRWMWIISSTCISILGAGLMAFLPSSNRAGLLVSVYLVNAIPGATPLVFQWLMSNTAGRTKRVFASIALSTAFSLGNVIGPQTFRSQEAPSYRSAKIATMAFWACGVVLSMVLLLYYIAANKVRDRKALAGQEKVPTVSSVVSLTDKQDPNFRYQL